MRMFPIGCLVCFPMALTAQSITVIDDNFDNYSSIYNVGIVSPIDPGVNYSYVDDDVMNDPGPPANTYATLYHIHDVPRDDDTNEPLATQEVNLQSLVRNGNVSYDPVVSGPVASLDFRLDYRTSDPFGELFFLIERNANGAAAGFTSVIADGQWHTLSVSGLLASDFGGLDYNGNIPFRFGYGFLSSGTPDAMSTDPLTYSVDTDNFFVSVNPVPEPGVALLLSGISLMGLRRRR